MKGQNVFVFNQGTMMEIVEHYLNDHMLSKDQHVTVLSVKEETTASDNKYKVTTTVEKLENKPSYGQTQ